MNTTTRIILVTTLLAAPLHAIAGYKATEPVVRGSGYAAGSLGSTRNSADTVQNISCDGTGYGNGTTPHVGCQAKDAAGNISSCYADGVGFLTALSAMRSDSYVYFSFNAQGVCTNIIVYNLSYSDVPVP